MFDLGATLFLGFVCLMAVRYFTSDAGWRWGLSEDTEGDDDYLF